MEGSLVRSHLALAVLAISALAGCEGTTPPGASAPDCVDAGGICLPAGECTQSSGTVSATTTDCYSDTEQTECCMAATPQPGVTTCEGLGGLCVAVADCTPGKGYFTVKGDDCQGPDRGCCVPHARCGDATIQCCAPGGDYVPLCDEGMLVCVDGREETLGPCH